LTPEGMRVRFLGSALKVKSFPFLPTPFLCSEACLPTAVAKVMQEWSRLHEGELLQMDASS
jgi:hypothetical protein